MNPNDVLGETIEKGQKTAKQTITAVGGIAKTVVGQVVGDSSQSGTNETNTAASDQQTANSKAQTEELVKELYAPSKPQDIQSQVDKQQSEKDAQAKLANIRQKLHDEVYYEPLIQGQKNQEEERPVEKVEREKKQEMHDLQKKEAKKPAPLVVQRAQQTAEKFRGVSG